MPIERINRLLRLIAILQRDEPNSTAGLMSELGVSRRTLFRDLQTISEAGVPYHHDRDQGYQLDKDYCLPPSDLTIEETLGLKVLAKSVVNHRGRPLVEPMLSAINKILSTVPEPIRLICDELIGAISISPEKRVSDEKELHFYSQFQRHIDEHRSCRIVYQELNNEDDLHAIFDPYLLHYVNRAWYVFGYTDIYDEVRMLRLARFVEVEPTDEYFEQPENFKASDKLGNAWHMIPEGREYDIELEFSSKVARNVTDFTWHSTQQHQILEDGRCRMTFRIDGLGEIAWWICGYADQVRVIKPVELRDRVARMLRSAARQYEQKQPPKVKVLVKRPLSKHKQ